MIFLDVFFVCTRHGDLYLKLAKKGMEKGADYAKNEIQRLERMLEKVIYHIFMLNITNVSETTMITWNVHIIMSDSLDRGSTPWDGRSHVHWHKTMKQPPKNNIVVLIQYFSSEEHAIFLVTDQILWLQVSGHALLYILLFNSVEPTRNYILHSNKMMIFLVELSTTHYIF